MVNMNESNLLYFDLFTGRITVERQYIVYCYISKRILEYWVYIRYDYCHYRM